MLDPTHLISALENAGVSFATGVPDSLLKEVCACITARFGGERHVVATNEGSAIGLAIGHFLATGNPALVYMQNSGLGNAINPITSLADPLVCGIPMVLLVGWRGETGPGGQRVADEPQHEKQGQITPSLLDTLGVPYEVLDATTTECQAIIERVTRLAMSRSGPVALLVRRRTFSAFGVDTPRDDQHLLTRETAILAVINALPEHTPIVSTTGMASRELFEIRKAGGVAPDRDFLTVGGMGHASQIASGIARARPGQAIVCLDGDGAFLMHMGGLVISAREQNLIHIVINNGAHDSVGGQPTAAVGLDLAGIARGCGYGFAEQASTGDEIRGHLQTALRGHHSAFLEIICKRGARVNLGRPDRPPAVNKEEFMRFLKNTGHA